MGDHIGVPYKPLAKDLSAMASAYVPLSTKRDINDLHSTSLEMEPLQQMNREDINCRTYYLFGYLIKGIRLNRKFAFCMIFVFVGILLIGIALKSERTNPKSVSYLFASTEDIEELHLSVN